jgi:hypothetical protein
MARTKRIAPTLRSVIEWPVPERFIAPGGNGAVAAVHVHVQAKAELRALLAVARAAEAEVRGWRGIYGSNNLNAHHPLVRALSRLSRASQPKGGAR